MPQKYKCLNPVGIHDPVEMYPLSKRLDTLKGKNIFSASAPAASRISSSRSRKDCKATIPRLTGT